METSIIIIIVIYSQISSTTGYRPPVVYVIHHDPTFNAILMTFVDKTYIHT